MEKAGEEHKFHRKKGKYLKKMLTSKFLTTQENNLFLIVVYLF